MSALNFTHCFVPPHAAAANPRVLLLLHGTGGDESDLLPLGRALDPSAALLSPRGKVSENGQARFFRRLAEGIFDEQDVIRRAHELADFLEAASTEYGFEQERVVAVGYSNGANVAAAILLLGRAAFRRAILLRAMTPLTPKTLPDARHASVLICEGEGDPIVPRESAETLAALLREAGAEVTLRFHSARHELTDADLAAARQWLVQFA